PVGLRPNPRPSHPGESIGRPPRTPRHPPPRRVRPTALLGRAPRLRCLPLRAHHSLVRRAQARVQCRRPFHAPGRSGEHRGQSRPHLRPRTLPLGRHAHGRRFHLCHRLSPRRRDGCPPPQLCPPPRAPRPAPRRRPPLGFARRRVAPA